MVSYSGGNTGVYAQGSAPFFHRLTSTSSTFSNDQTSTYSYNSSVSAAVSNNVVRSKLGKELTGSQETLSLISRSLTASSVNSTSTSNTTFESNWLPNSEVVKPQTFKITLKLSPKEIELLRWSWQVVTSTESRAGDDAASIKSVSSTTFNTADFSSYLFCVQFYNNLISMDGAIEEMIPSIRHQASAFAGVLNYAISTLEDLSKMHDTLINLGKLHARILGIDSPYFQTMGEALMKTFRDWFGKDEESFPLELEEGWIKLYGFLANSIIQGGIDPAIEYGIDDGSSTISRQNESSIDNSSLGSGRPAQEQAPVQQSYAASTSDESGSAPSKHFKKSHKGNSSNKKSGRRGLRRGKDGEDGDCIIM
ncbi:DEKNAAC101731 [Brettanomyces naardenensis]|uniref:DEKNAAC101731 n=1 Tax=Brettanomyces naardenensis TaxID=13370 RepID=A0A448YIX2_BRENA|nr:DEKNAAC101731 [Brettanomyces naardenensis]